ncbi:MAG: restriction modification system DNA specificity subunit [Parcubacteria group bacterium GW2011_GWF2_38_8]|nr:MAG: restriction modification system DNA specificity subunit [Parcubacteria group bacterium GW2011_GWF2_38_8]
MAKNKFIKFGDTLINSTGVGTLGRVSIVSFPESDRTVDSHITICRANKNEVQPLYLGYTVKFFQPYFEYMATGATGQVELNKGLIETIEIVLPSTELQTNFQDRIEKILEQKNYFIKKNSNLKQTRDRLLTRLISGKLSVADLDIRFPRSMREESDAELHP